MPGDIDPRLATKYADLLAIPLHYLYSQIHNQLHWPTLWKTETVTLIPKNSAPEGLAQLRNLSCTPLFSKLLESFILGTLKQKVKLTRNQFGGIKGVGVNHFLAETWDQVLSSLEDCNAAVSLMSIDFEKAFNRMDHRHCITSLQALGADEGDIQLVQAFLHGRRMQVKVGKTRSVPRTVPGGSPQGSILGNFLFCASTNEFAADGNPEVAVLADDEDQEAGVEEDLNGTPNFSENGRDMTGSPLMSSGNGSEPSSPIAPPGTGLLELGSESDSDDSFQYFRTRPRNFLDDTEEITDRYTQHQLDASLGVPPNWRELPLGVKVYIDDLNNVEKVRQAGAISEISENKQVLLAHAPKSEENFTRICRRASEVNMRVNSSKTQLLCISGNVVSKVKSYIKHEEKEIRSGHDLKILGFWFGERPNVEIHVKKMLEKFRSRIWALRHLRRSGICQSDLLYIYQTVLRPVLDFAAPVYHPILTSTQRQQIERLQLRSLKIIYGYDYTYKELLEKTNTPTLEERREELLLSFALKTQNNPRFADAWFPKRTNNHYQLRNNRIFKEFAARTERQRNNPIHYMRRALNDHFEKETINN